MAGGYQTPTSFRKYAVSESMGLQPAHPDDAPARLGRKRDQQRGGIRLVRLGRGSCRPPYTRMDRLETCERAKKSAVVS